MSGRRAWLPCERPIPVPPSLLTTPQLETAVCRLLALVDDAHRNGTDGDFGTADLDHQAALAELFRRYGLEAGR